MAILIDSVYGLHVQADSPVVWTLRNQSGRLTQVMAQCLNKDGISHTVRIVC